MRASRPASELSAADPPSGYLTSRLTAANSDLSAGRTHEEIAQSIGEHLPLERTARILEIGVGFGPVLDFLRDAGWTAYEGIDIDRECVESCESRHPVKLVADAGEFLASHPGEYHAIILRQVIAHLSGSAAIELLRSVRGALTDDGLTIVQTFNAALPSAGYTFANDLTHRGAYTEHSLRQALAMAGFAGVEIRPGAQPTRGLRGLGYRFARGTYILGLRGLMGLERGFGNNPRIWSRELVALARKR